MSEASVRVSEEARKRATKSATFTPCAAAGQRQSIALPLLKRENMRRLQQTETLV